jgi:hypothetical protein
MHRYHRSEAILLQRSKRHLKGLAYVLVPMIVIPLLCGARWSPIARKVRGRILLVCRACDARPETAARLDELVAVDWQESREAVSS